MRLVAEMAELMGASRLLPISSAHIDGCLYHGDSGTLFAEHLIAGGGRVAVPTTLNVGALDLLHPDRVRVTPARGAMARRLMDAYVALGCRPSWTCAPYQAGHRPALGENVAWGESNAVVFANSVLGARTNRYGDFLDIAAAIAGRAPAAGLHLDKNRCAELVIDVTALSSALRNADVFYPVLGAWLGHAVGGAVAVIDGLPPEAATEDRLKALGAAAASTGAIGLFHVAGVTPEAATVEQAAGGQTPSRVIPVTPDELRAARDRLSTVADGSIDAIAVGSPHFSIAEFAQLEALLRGRRLKIPFYVCAGRDTVALLEDEGRLTALEAAGITVIADTCVVVTPILPETGRVLMTNSGKFAFYTPANTGYGVVYGSLAECVASAETGRVMREERLWA